MPGSATRQFIERSRGLGRGLHGRVVVRVENRRGAQFRIVCRGSTRSEVAKLSIAQRRSVHGIEDAVLPSSQDGSGCLGIDRAARTKILIIPDGAHHRVDVAVDECGNMRIRYVATREDIVEVHRGKVGR